MYLTLENDAFVSATSHNHEPQPAEFEVHRSKVKLKNLASTSMDTTKQLIAKSVCGLSFESRSRVNCEPESLERMVRRAKQIFPLWNSGQHQHPLPVRSPYPR